MDGLKVAFTTLMVLSVAFIVTGYDAYKELNTVEAKQEAYVNSDVVTNDYLLVVDGGVFIKSIISKEIVKDSEKPNAYNYIYGMPNSADSLESVGSEDSEIENVIANDNTLEGKVTVTLAKDTEAESQENSVSQENSSDVWVSYTATDDVDIYVLDDVTRNQYYEMKYEICDIVF